jgi:hypothetical protein
VTADVAAATNWRSGSEYAGSPGREGLAPVIDVVVNEVLANPGAGEIDAIELHNTTEQAIDVGGWYLSDSSDNYRKFAIPAGTVLPPGGYVAFDADDFNASGGVDPGDFGLSGSHGDDVWLLATNAEGQLVRFVDHVEFGATAGGESVGRWPDGGELYPMSEPPLGAANAGVRIGPVIVSEVQYHPSSELAWLEYVELFNTTDAAIDLGGWRLGGWWLDGGIEYDFPPGTSIAAGATLVVVPFDPADTPSRLAFEAFYGLSGTIAMAGPYTGSLNNAGESVALLRPGTPPPDEPSFTPHLLVDAVTYDDESPWPTSADGGGSSLARRSDRSLGHSADGWTAAAPSPGAFSPQVGVLGSYVFYRGSTFDNPAKGRTADDAIATDKTPLRPGETATLANYTSFSRGINGITIDVIGLADGVVPALSDFAFRVGNRNELETWTAAPAPEPILVRTSAGTGGADRITITWPDGAIQNEWLEVTVLAAGLGLADDAVFYWGNAIGESGDTASHALVNVTDALAVLAHPRSPLDPASLADRYDFNRDGLVDAVDVTIVLQHMTSPLSALRLIAPVSAQEAAAHDAAMAESSSREPVRPLPLERRAVGRDVAAAAALEYARAQRPVPRVHGPQKLAIDRVLALYGE